MLHPIYAFKDSGITTEYNSTFALKAVKGFLATIPRGKEIYQRGIVRMCCELYREALVGSDSLYFLDKTPRYYFVIRELAELFPNARFVFLLRNPMAVLVSIIKTWVKDNPFWLREYKSDLLIAPANLVRGIEDLSANAIVVHFEQLVQQPETELRRLCAYLSLEFEPEMLNYVSNDLPRWEYGDQVTVYQAAAPLTTRREAWIDALDAPQIWRFVSNYKSALGAGIIEAMGYSIQAIQRALDARRPPRWKLYPTFGLGDALEQDDERSQFDLRKIVARRMLMIQKWGIRHFLLRPHRLLIPKKP
jgi:hypothetical protein